MRYSYVRPVAENRAWKLSAAGSSAETAMSAGRRALTPRPSSAVPSMLVVRKSMTCPLACTPASVRPAPITRTASAQTLPIARSSSACTVGAFGCTWNPAYRVPSYDTVAFQCGVLGRGSLLRRLLLRRGRRPLARRPLLGFGLRFGLFFDLLRATPRESDPAARLLLGRLSRGLRALGRALQSGQQLNEHLRRGVADASVDASDARVAGGAVGVARRQVGEELVDEDGILKPRERAPTRRERSVL